jgi:diguanylate cyclase (GGDEF) domain
MLDGITDIILKKMSQLAESPLDEDLTFEDLPDEYESLKLQMQALKNKIGLFERNLTRKNNQIEYSHVLMTSLMLDTKKWIIVIDSETGKEIFLNNTAKFIMKSDAAFSGMLHKTLIKCNCNKENSTVFWEYVYEDENRKNSDNKMYYTINSYYIPWDGDHAVAHVIDDNTAARRVEVEMHAMAFKDSLTDLYNRRYAMKLLENWYNEGVDFCISFIDIDYLKYCNDVFGHEEGNQYILLVTDFLNKLPEEKILCRIGGDEFMVIKRDIPIEKMNDMLGKIRDSLISYEDVDLNYHRSYSYGSCKTNYSEPVSLDKILRVADQEMYKFKYANKQK